MKNEASWDYPQEVIAASDDVTNVDTEKDEDKNDQVDLDVTMFIHNIRFVCISGELQSYYVIQQLSLYPGYCSIPKSRHQLIACL